MFPVHIVVVQKDLSMSNHIPNALLVRGLWMTVVGLKQFNVSFQLRSLHNYRIE